MSSGAGLKQAFTYAIWRCFYGPGKKQPHPPTAPVGMTILLCNWLCDLVVSLGPLRVRMTEYGMTEVRIPHLKSDVGEKEMWQPGAG